MGAQLGASDGSAVVTHFVDSHGQRALEPLHDHPERVADEDDVDSGLVDQAGHRKVVRRYRDDARARNFHSPDIVDGDLVAGSSAVAAGSHSAAEGVASSPTDGKMAIPLSPHYVAPSCKGCGPGSAFCAACFLRR